MDPEAFNAFEAEGWNAKAAGYDAFLAPITARVVEPLLDAAGVRSGQRVLDVATGPGHAGARAATRGAQVVGIDVAPAMLAIAAERHPELELHLASAEDLPFEDGSFDAVFGNFVLLHLGRPEQGVAELARVLAPGGRLALTVWDVPERARLQGVVLDAVHEVGATPPPDLPPGPPLFRFSDDREMAELLTGASLSDVESETVAFGHRLLSPDELWDGVLASAVRLGPLIFGQSEETQREIRAAFDRLVEEHRSGDGYELPVSVKLGSARKPGS